MGWVTSTEWQPAPRPVLRPLYAVGDVHGAADLLALLQGKLREINATGRLVYLGDLIDPSKHVRNYDVARTLDLVAAGSRVEGLDESVLMGNHDQFYSLALAAAGTGDPLPYERGTWIDQGGKLTAEAWRLQDETNERALALAMWIRMSKAQRAVFDRMRVFVEHDDYLLVHAGFCDYLPLQEMLAKDWRSEFPLLRSEEAEHPLWMRLHGEDVDPAGRTMIVGHTPYRSPYVGRNVINIDTGAKLGGPLTMLEIVHDRMRFHQAWPSGLTPEEWEK